MENQYNFKEIESRWQRIWQEAQPSKSMDFDDKPKHYHLVEFPYPSGSGLHVGHCMGYGASDAYCRMKRMQGYNVLFPIGFDAFGLPTENYAIKNKIKPQKATEDNIATFKKQMSSIGMSFDWNREVNTTDPAYYKWTQWIFLQFYKHAVVDGNLIEVADDDTTTPRLAFQAEMPINWCSKDKIGLANEEVINGKCERCGTEVFKKMQKQWMLRITSYADRLISDLDLVDYLPKIKTQQVNWIGKSMGSLIKFKVESLKSKVSQSQGEDNSTIEVFTTRSDTLFGCTYVVLAPEHPLIENLKPQISNPEDVQNYIDQAKKKSDMERTELAKEKTGVKLEGIKAINPINNEEVDVYAADYVLANYGTGAVMAVPAHDERDWEFAKKYDISIKEVVLPVEGEKHEDEETRHTVTAIVPDKEGKKFLMIYWNEFGWHSPVAGGIDEGETPEEAVAREVLEETGYKIEPIEKLGGQIEMHFFTDNKKVWRERFDQPILCRLIDENQYDVNDEEKGHLKVLWLTFDEVMKKTTHKFNTIGFDRFQKKNYSFADYGKSINSGEFTGLSSNEAKIKITEKLKEIGAGDFTVNFKLRDWVFSRQHYWGEPIPIIHCDKCGKIPLPEDQLPLTLPDVEHYEPTDTGESPLAAITDWLNVACPKCGVQAKRETDTMPNWAGSSWYFLRYCDPKNSEQFASDDKLKYWMPVDLYNGGMEHTTLHLLYSRFWHKFLFDLKAVPGPEPYQKRIAHGIILGPDGRKMSKSFGNVINPDDITSQFGADTLRAYVMFIGPYDQESAWSTAAVQGVYRFLTRLFKNYSLAKEDHQDSKQLLVKLNQTIKGISEDIEAFRFNTVVSKLMEMNNVIEKEGSISKTSYEKFIRLLFPIAPHLASELWKEMGHLDLLDNEMWPEHDPIYLIADEIEIVISVNGKVRDRLMVNSAISKEEIEKLAVDSEKAKQFIGDGEIVKIIVIPGKLVNLVVKG